MNSAGAIQDAVAVIHATGDKCMNHRQSFASPDATPEPASTVSQSNSIHLYVSAASHYESMNLHRRLKAMLETFFERQLFKDIY